MDWYYMLHNWPTWNCLGYQNLLSVSNYLIIFRRLQVAKRSHSYTKAAKFN